MRGLNSGILILLVALCVGTPVSVVITSYPTQIGRINNQLYDLWLTKSKVERSERGPLVIDIDEDSLKKIGQLPWPRTILADLTSTLLNNGASAIGLDIWLTEPDRSSPIAVDSQLEKNFGVNLDFSNLPMSVLDNDRYFRNAIAGKPVVIGGLATFEENEGQMSDLPDSPVVLKGEVEDAASGLATIPEAAGFIPPLPIFSSVAPVSILNVTMQEDGVVRSMPLLIRVKDEIYAGLALQTLLMALGDNDLRIGASPNGLIELQAGQYKIPVEKDGSFRPLYRGGSRSLPYISAVEVLDGKIPRKEIEGRICIVGSSAHSLLNQRATPFDVSVPGAEVHATIIDNILAGESVRVPAYEKELQIAMTYLSTLIGAAAFCLLPFFGYFILYLALCGLYIWLSWLFFENGLFISPLGPLLGLTLAGAVLVPLRYWSEQAERRKFRQAFGRYVSPEVVAKIVTDGEKLLKGEQKEATIMFTDVRGFTSISEKLEPPQLVRLLNCYFTPMTACVTARNGTLDKFIGDSLMAFWNAPIDIENHPLQAVMAALEMQSSLAALRPSLKEEFDVDLRMGIGINSGPVHVGNMGSVDLLDYTCIGDTVNLASRLEGMCKRYGMDIVISESVKNSCGSALDFLILDKIRVKGSLKPLKIFTPLAPDENLDKNIENYWHEAMNAYFEGDFGKARVLFDELKNNSFLHVACLLFCSRCEDMKEKPDVEWDGVWTYNDK